MESREGADAGRAPLRARAAEILADQRLALSRRTDRMFAWLLALQWAAGIVFALVFSPRAWNGAESVVHVNVQAAVLLGALIASLPILLVRRAPGAPLTRHAVAAAQMLYSALFIHLTGGRIETHFHIFGSLAFLAFYRDWRVLATATLLVAADHGFRGVFWPQSVYGVGMVQPWRFLEHTAWVAFEDLFLFVSIFAALDEMRAAASRQARLEELHANVERTVAERTEALRRSNEELEQFAYVASHDLQEPLRNVTSFTQLLAARYSDRLDAEGRRFIDFAVSGSMRMQRLIQDLLAYSRLGTDPRPFGIERSEALLARALSNLESSIQETHAVVTHDELPVVTADGSQMVQLLQNLLGNAIKFRGPAAPRVHVGARREGDDWLFSVRDEGIGIDPRYSDRVFLIFQRLHTRQEYPGNGIGLAICKKIVERHGGRIWFESRPGDGTTFLFTLPAAAVRPAPTEGQPSRSAERNISP